MMLAGLLGVTSCSNFTDIQPKGVNTLSTTDQLELLFNNEITLDIRDLQSIGGDIVSGTNNIPADMTMENKERNTLLFGYYDDSKSLERLKSLTSSDSYYSSCYSWVGRICNPVINQVGTAKGDDSKKAALTAEAKALRAFAHFMVAVKFAKAYNPATASQEQGIIYMTETKDIQTPQKPSTLKESYDQMLADVNAAINSGAMPKKQTAKTRFTLGAAYALKAHILMAMQQYAEAADAAKASLGENSSLLDYYSNTHKENGWGAFIHYPGDWSYDVCTPNCLKDVETLFAIPDYLIGMWGEPAIEKYVEPGYGRFTLTPRTKVQYLGFEAMIPGYDQSLNMIGIRGWDSPYNMPGVNMEYRNIAGLTVPQMYILLAECSVRDNKIDDAMGYLDKLRQNRLPADTYQPLKGTVSSITDAIEKVKQASFSENLWTCWNFIQRKRWNVEQAWQTTLSHDYSSIGFGIRTLRPESGLWVFPYPISVVEANPYIN